MDLIEKNYSQKSFYDWKFFKIRCFIGFGHWPLCGPYSVSHTWAHERIDYKVEHEDFNTFEKMTDVLKRLQ